MFVGSASKPAVEEVEEAFEAANPNIKLDITFGGSGTLLNQMTLEETGDVYMPGSDDYMDRAEQREAIKPETRQIISWLVPAIIVPKGNPKNIRTLKDLARPGMRIGLAKPDAVCLGNISEEILADVGLLEEVKKNVCAYGLSCSKTAHLAELGEVDAIIGWEVFAKWSPDKVETIPLRAKTARVRNIPAAQSAFTKQPELAQEFIDFLTSPVAQQIFQRHGYALQKPGAE
ncbi:MAG: molybdate ABC transporter substrate-binding protein [Armatimonadetes bacterium]|nr:molybdate ABC transporter substrate-binding protein [Armatimonadota bacterium]NIO75671.1 molybdate ABC transporter substrate-binding protein [Armatimonadota bacterium]NIO98665.1 molybdate ABC transporter substrate-binding protein [Armatimonadota bacterium]